MLYFAAKLLSLFAFTVHAVLGCCVLHHHAHDHHDLPLCSNLAEPSHQTCHSHAEPEGESQPTPSTCTPGLPASDLDIPCHEEDHGNEPDCNFASTSTELRELQSQSLIYILPAGRYLDTCGATHSHGSCTPARPLLEENHSPSFRRCILHQSQQR